MRRYDDSGQPVLTLVVDLNLSSHEFNSVPGCRPTADMDIHSIQMSIGTDTPPF